MKTDSIFQNSIASAIYTGLSLLFPLIAAMYVSRILLAEGIGKVLYAQSIASYFTILAQLGIVSLGIREIAKVRDDVAQTSRVFSELLVLNGITTTAAIGLYLLLLVWKNGFADWPLFLATGLLVVFNYVNIDWFFQGAEKYTYITIRSAVVKTLALGGLFLFVHQKRDYVIYALITSLALGANNLFNVVYSRKFARFSLKHIRPQRFIKPLLILAGTAICGTLYSQLDTTMLGSMGSDQSVGWYNYAHKIAFLCISLSAAISKVFYPRLSYYYQTNKEQFFRLIEKGLEVLSFLTFPIAIGIGLLSTVMIVFFFGPSFAPASVTLRIFIPIVFIQSFGDLLCYQLMLVTGNEKKQLPIIVGGTVLNAVLNFVLIPYWMQNGAAIASVCTEFFINLLQFLYIRRYLALRVPFKPLLVGITNSVVMAGVLWLFLPYVKPTVWSLGWIVGLGGMVLNILEKNPIVYQLYAKCLPMLRKQ